MDSRGPLETANLALRVLIELVALVALGQFGYVWFAGSLGLVAAGAFPLVAMGLWATFRVETDPGSAPVPISGRGRLGLETTLLGIAAIALALTDKPGLALGFMALVVGHYLLDYERVWQLVIS